MSRPFCFCKMFQKGQMRPNWLIWSFYRPHDHPEKKEVCTMWTCTMRTMFKIVETISNNNVNMSHYFHNFTLSKNTNLGDDVALVYITTIKFKRYYRFGKPKINVDGYFVTAHLRNVLQNFLLFFFRFIINNCVC